MLSGSVPGPFGPQAFQAVADGVVIASSEDRRAVAGGCTGKSATDLDVSGRVRLRGIRILKNGPAFDGSIVAEDWPRDKISNVSLENCRRAPTNIHDVVNYD